MRLRLEDANAQLPISVRDVNPASRLAKILVIPGENCIGLRLIVSTHLVRVATENGKPVIERLEIVADYGPMVGNRPIHIELVLPTNSLQVIRLLAADADGKEWCVDGIDDEEAEALLEELDGDDRRAFMADRLRNREATAPRLSYVNVQEGVVS